MRRIGDKYAAKHKGLMGIVLYNTLTGEEIPEDEPLFVLRGRDKLAMDTLKYYFAKCQAENCTIQHLDGVRSVMREFHRFVHSHAERMKEPGNSFRRGHAKSPQSGGLPNEAYLGDKR